MVFAANSVRQTVFRERLVVDLHVTGQVGQQVAHEPGEAVCLADAAQGNLEIGSGPRMPRSRDGRARTAAPSAGGLAAPGERLWPEVIEHLSRHGIAHELACAVGECGEEILFLDAQILVRNLAAPAVEIDLSRANQAVFDSRNANRRRFGKVVVDDQVEREAVVLRRDTCRRRSS